MDTPNIVAAEEQNVRSNPTAEGSWADVLGLPMGITVALRILKFAVRDLLELEVNSIVDTGISATDAVPVWVNGVTIGTAEFDVLGTRLAIRLSELH